MTTDTVTKLSLIDNDLSFKTLRDSKAAGQVTIAVPEQIDVADAVRILNPDFVAKTLAAAAPFVSTQSLEALRHRSVALQNGVRDKWEGKEIEGSIRYASDAELDAALAPPVEPGLANSLDRKKIMKWGAGEEKTVQAGIEGSDTPLGELARTPTTISGQPENATKALNAADFKRRYRSGKLADFEKYIADNPPTP